MFDVMKADNSSCILYEAVYSNVKIVVKSSLLRAAGGLGSAQRRSSITAICTSTPLREQGSKRRFVTMPRQRGFCATGSV